MTHRVFCVKLNKEAPGLNQAPLPNALGMRIYEHVSAEGWRLWLKHQTLLINEHRLNLTEAKNRQFLANEMEKFFFGEGSQTPDGFSALKN
jgi:Fe-S cluster biosynthesis and repair protein YggX